jgi:probable addiction module antidote protein
MGRPVTQPKTKIELLPWDVADHLDSEEAMVGYLNAVLGEDDPILLMAALGDVARAKGMTQVSRETGLGRESLYKALSLQGNPEFATVQKVLRSLGLRLRVSV